jgi:tetratricopeptide (TPR) repeat protein
MNIDEQLEQLEKKMTKKSAEEAQLILSIVRQNPCHFKARLILIDTVGFQRDYFDFRWRDCALEALAIAIEHQCWSLEQIALLYLKIAEWYWDEQRNDQHMEYIDKAFRTYPNHPKVINSYLSNNIKLLDDKTVLSLVDKMVDLDPQNPMRYFLRGSYIRDIFKRDKSKQEYRDMAIESYQKALDLGLSYENGGLPPIAAEHGIQQLKDI